MSGSEWWVAPGTGWVVAVAEAFEEGELATVQCFLSAVVEAAARARSA